MIPLISPKPFSAYGVDGYHAYISSMYALPEPKRGAKPKSPICGLSVCRTKTGKVSVKRTAKSRPFPYATQDEVRVLAAHAGCTQAELWNELKRREFLIGPDRISCEKMWAALQEIPF